jgi:PAS domain S-box-containing protein
MKPNRIHQNIDEQKRAEKALKESRKRLRKIIGLVPDPIFVKNRAGEYLLVNEAVAEMFGRSVEEMLGKTEAELGMSDDRFKAYRTEDQEVIESGESMTISERNAMTADGESFTLQTVLIPSEPVGADSEGVLGYARNITERTEYESQIEVQRDTLKILNQMVRHDIRNDLQVVVSYSELLKEQTGPGKTDLARTVHEAARDAVEITETARDVADVVLESETEMESQSLKSVLGEEVDRASSKYDSTRIALENSIPDVSILVDGMAESLFRNLLQNAIVHNDKSEPEVTVTTMARNERVRIEVKDNDPGITEEQKPEIFEKGAQGLDSEGAGLGLYLVRTLVDRYDGRLHVEDNEPEGSVFVVELPRADAASHD